MSLTCNLYHIVFNTKRREMTINLSHETDLYRYLWRILEDRKCKLLRIGGIPLTMFTSLLTCTPMYVSQI